MTGPSNDPLFVSPGIPAGSVRRVAAAWCRLLSAVRVTAGRDWRNSWVGGAAAIVDTFFHAVSLVSSAHAVVVARGIAIPQSRYSTGVFAVMHSAQYLWITSYYARREAGTKGEAGWRPFAYFAVLIAGGIALFIPGPWLASRLFHFDFAASFLIFTALVNIHHFILDGAIWKLRDNRIAALLLNSRERLSDATADAGRRLGKQIRWLVGNSSPARTLRIGRR